MIGKDYLKELGYKASEYLPRAMHAVGSALSVASGAPTMSRNPGYVFNVAVAALLGYEALPSKPHKDYPPSTPYNGLVGAYRGVKASRNVKALFGVALAVKSIWFLLQGNLYVALEDCLFDIGLLLSVGGSEIEKRRVVKELKELEKDL